MGTVVIHAGMPKAGSSSIQHWLEGASADLRAQGVGVLLATDRGSDHVRVIPHESGSVLSGQFIYGYLAFDRHPAVLERFVDGIDRWTREFDTTVVTAEGLANFVTPPDPAFLRALEQLGRVHDVRVAYYVRPQHTSMEAAWCQWGYRMDGPPSSYLARWAETLDYHGTVEQVRAVAPDLDLDVRPFRTDLLEGGDVVTDFARHFLGVAAPGERGWSNRSLSVDVVNVLRGTPTGVLWQSPHDNRTLDRIRDLLLDVELEPTPEAERSRAILHRYCHARFERGNQALIAERAWATDAFIPPPPPGPAPLLSAIDPLWSHPSPEVTRRLLLGVLGGVAAKDPRG